MIESPRATVWPSNRSSNSHALVFSQLLEASTKSIDQVQPFPSEIGIVPAEVTIASGLRIDRSPQVEVLDDPECGQFNQFSNAFFNLILRLATCLLGVHRADTGLTGRKIILDTYGEFRQRLIGGLRDLLPKEDFNT